MAQLLILIFLVVLAATTMIGIWWNSRQSATAGAPLAEGEGQSAPRVAAALQWVGDVRPTRGAKGDSARRLLAAAGYRSGAAPSIYQGVKYVGAAALAVAGFLSGALAGGDSFIGAVALGGLGFFLPDRVLKFLADRRKRRLRTALPAAMDLLVLSIEAGQSLDMALMETARGIRNTYPELAQEFNTLTGDLRANTSRADSLRLFYERSGEPELKKVSALLTDTDRFGNSLGPALRNHAKYLRLRMRQQAQEAARKVGVKLIFPVFFLIFPSVLLVTLGPAVIMVTKQMKAFLAM
jgi:tight adherence protein C